MKGVILYQKMVRGSPDSRLGDVAGITAVLFAWLSAVAWASGRWPGRLLKPLVLVAMLVTIASAWSFGQVLPRLADAGVNGPTNLVRRARDVAV